MSPKYRRLIDSADIETRIEQLALEVNKEYMFSDGELTLLVVLNGALYFGADLSRHIHRRHVVDTMRVTTYQNNQSGGTVRDVVAPKTSLADRHVLIVEDIVDTGFTLTYLRGYVLNVLAARSCKVATLLFKPDIFGGSELPEFIGFNIKPLYVVGYGMDDDEELRHMEHIYFKENKS
jgi:hypoxanthine phosphoribosyltransferase